MSAYNVRCHEHLSLAGIQELFAKLPGGAVATPFQTPMFLHAFSQTMLEDVGGQFAILELLERESEQSLLLLPIISRKRGFLRIASFPDLTLADQCAPVLAQDVAVPAEDYETVCQALLSAIPDADLVDFYNMPVEVKGRPNPLVSMRSAEPTVSTLVLDLGGDNDPWRKKQAFKHVPRKARRLEEQGVEFFEACDPETRLKVFEELLEQRRKRFEKIGLSNGLEKPGQVDFFRMLASRPYPESPVRIFALKRDEELIAINYCMVTDNVLNTVLPTIGDEVWSKYSPGIVLQLKALEWAEGAGIPHYSFGIGLQDYKKRFGATALAMKNLSRSLNLKGRLYLLVRSLVWWCKAQVAMLRPSAPSVSVLALLIGSVGGK